MRPLVALTFAGGVGAARIQVEDLQGALEDSQGAHKVVHKHEAKGDAHSRSMDPHGRYFQTPNVEYCPDSQNIVTEEECRQAAGELGLEWNSAWADPTDHRYCQFTGSRGVYFNTAGYAVRPQGPHYYSVCRAHPHYIQTPNVEYCPDNRNIETEEECHHAAEELGLEWNSAWADPADHRYCQFTGSRGVYFNTAGYAIRPQGPHYYSLCHAGPYVLVGDGPCRNANGEIGPYTPHDGVADLEACKDLCSGDAQCVGIEYIELNEDGSFNGHCELHQEPVFTFSSGTRAVCLAMVDR